MAQGVGSIITSSVYNQMLPHCNSLYTYEAFITAANSFPEFGTTGDLATRKRELAAFFGQTSHETTGGWPTAPDGELSWGYYFTEEIAKTDPPYYGRGPIQLTQYNYEQAGRAIHVDLVNNPGLASSDPVISFRTAIWFWMTPQSPKPSCHDVMTGRWNPSDADRAAGRLPGYGITTNIINGGLECNTGQPDPRVENRVNFYKRYCDMFGVSYGDNLSCMNQRPYN